MDSVPIPYFNIPIENSCTEKTYMHVQNVRNCGSCREWVRKKHTCTYKTYGKLHHSAPPQDAVFRTFCMCMYVFSVPIPYMTCSSVHFVHACTFSPYMNFL